MLAAETLLICAILLTLLYWKLKTTASSHEPPIFPGSLPLIGNSLMIFGDTKHFWNVIKKISNKSLSDRRPYTLIFGLRKYYVLTDPGECLAVANSCLRKDVAYDFAKPCFGDGLVTACVPIWKQHRKLLNPVFNQKYMLDFLGVFNEQARNLVKNLTNEVGETAFDHEHYVRYIAMEAICIAALGTDFNKNNWDARYRAASDDFFKIICERFQKVWLHNDFTWSLSSRKKSQDKHVKELHDISNTILKNRRKTLHSNENCNLDYTGKKFKPFLDLLFELNEAHGEEIFTDQLIREHVDTFIVAGFDTVATTLVYTLLLIGSYPDVQNKIYAELREVFGESDRDVAKEDFPQLVYLEAVIKESMRVYPVVPVIARKLEKDVKLKDCTLYSGNACLLMICAIHTHPMWGDDSKQFKPERWLGPSTLPNNSSAFVAFGLGRRVCIGRTYAMLFMKTTIAHVLRQYQIRGDHNKMINKFDVMLKPVMGHYISIERRPGLNSAKNTI